MNRMKEIATILDVELNEPFDIINVDSNNKFPLSFCLSHKGLMYADESNYSSNEFSFSDLLQKILIGEYKIIKKPFVPIDGNIYWMVTFDGKPKTFRFNETSPEHLLLYEAKKIYNTCNEAIKHSKEDKADWEDMLYNLLKDMED